MSTRTPSTSARATWLAGLALLSALVAGGALGYRMGRQSLMKRPGPPGSESPITMLGVTRASLTDSLRLTPTQRPLVESLLDRAELDAQAAVDTLIGSVKASTDRIRQQIRDLLDDQQRVRFDSTVSGSLPVLPRTPFPPRR